MTRVIRAGLIQASLGDDVPTELESLKTHLIEKHLALSTMPPTRVSKFSACRSCSTALTSAPNKTGVGMPWPRRFRKALRSA